MGYDDKAAEAAMDAIEEAQTMMGDPNYFGNLTLEELADIKGYDAVSDLSDRGKKSVEEASDNLVNLEGSIWEAFKAIEGDDEEALKKAALEVADVYAQIPDPASVTTAFEEAVDRVYEEWKKDAVEALKTRVTRAEDGTAAVLAAIDVLGATNILKTLDG